MASIVSEFVQMDKTMDTSSYKNTVHTDGRTNKHMHKRHNEVLMSKTCFKAEKDCGGWKMYDGVSFPMQLNINMPLDITSMPPLSYIRLASTSKRATLIGSVRDNKQPS